MGSSTGSAASPGAAGGARWPQSPSPTYPGALQLRPETGCDPGFRGATRTGSARGPGARPAGPSTGGQEGRVIGAPLTARLRCCGSVAWGLPHHTPCGTESWDAPKGINGSLNAVPTTRRPAVLPAGWGAEATGSDGANGCPCPLALRKGRPIRAWGPPRGRGSLTRRVSLKTGFRFRFFTVVLRLLCLSGRR